MNQPIKIEWEEVRLPKLGVIVAFTTEKGVCAINFGEKVEDVIRDLQVKYGRSLKAVRGITTHGSVLASLREYVMGWRTTFDIPLHFLYGTLFQKSVWEILRKIPYGTCVSYQWVARKAGKPTAARAVGNAVGKNPIPIIVPCHRVIRRDGSLGGFSAGVSFKKTLLEIEGCEIKRRREREFG